ncbi:MAG TPA: hypothetical protein VGD77_01250 [Gemmatimonadaceae bacterium]
MPFLARWRADRDLQRKAEAYVARLMEDPRAEDVAWLAEVATGGDEDHARWELRYARRAIGQVVAEKDALDDRTASLVARALGEALERDPAISVDTLAIAQQQFNARLSAYRDVLSSRASAPAVNRLAQMLLAFSGGPIGLKGAEVQRGGALFARCLADANEALRGSFGGAELPEDVKPSAMGR